MQAFHDGSIKSIPRTESATCNGGFVLDPFCISLPTDGLIFTDHHHEGRFDTVMPDPLMYGGTPPPSSKAPPSFSNHQQDPNTSGGIAKSPPSSSKTAAVPSQTSKTGGKTITTKPQQKQKQASKTKKVPKKAVSQTNSFKMKKAPGAPRRFKSAYMFFSTKKHKEFREELNKNGQAKMNTTDVAKLVSKAWKSLSAEERKEWDDVALADKKRYEVERAAYKGPWKVPTISAALAGKDPTAPKRPMSAFLAFSNDNRKAVKSVHTEMSNADITRILGQMWKELSAEDRRVYQEKEVLMRNKYKVVLEDWKKEKQATIMANPKKRRKKKQDEPPAKKSIGKEKSVPKISDASSGVVGRGKKSPASAEKNKKKNKRKKNGILAFTRRRHKKMKQKNKNKSEKDKAALAVSPTGVVGVGADSTGNDAASDAGGNNEDPNNQDQPESDEESYTTVTVFEYTSAVVVAAAAMFMASLLSLSSGSVVGGGGGGFSTLPPNLRFKSSFFRNKDESTATNTNSNTNTTSRSSNDDGDDGDDDTVTTEANRLRWIRLWRDLLLLPQTGSNPGNEISSLMIPITKRTLVRRTSSISLSSGLQNDTVEAEEQVDRKNTINVSDDSPATMTSSTESQQGGDAAAAADGDDEDYDWTPLWIAAAAAAGLATTAATTPAQLSNADDGDINTEEQKEKTNNESDETDETETTKKESPTIEDDINGLKDHHHHDNSPVVESPSDAAQPLNNDDEESAIFSNAALTASAAAVAATGAFFLWSSRGAQERTADRNDGSLDSVEDAQDETKVSTEDDADEEEEHVLVVVPAVVQSIGSSGSEEDTATGPPPQPAASDKKDSDMDLVEQDRESGGTETVLYPSEQKNEKAVKKKKESWKLWKKILSPKQQKADRVALVLSNDQTTSLSNELSDRSTNTDDKTVMIEESSPLGDRIIVDTSSIEVDNDEVDDDTSEIVHQFLAKSRFRKKNRKPKACVAAFERSSDKTTDRSAVDDKTKAETKRQAYFERYVEEEGQPTDDVDDQPTRSSSSYTDLRILEADNSNTNMLKSAASWDEYSYADNSQDGTVETKDSRSRGMKDVRRLRSDSEGTDDVELDDDASLVSVKSINIFKETTQEILKDVSFLYNREHHETFEHENEEDEDEIFDGLDDSLRTIDEGTIGSSSVDDRNLDSPIPFEMNDNSCHFIQDANNNSIGNDDVALTLTLDESFSVVDDDEDAGASAIQDVSPHTTPKTKNRLSILSPFLKRTDKHLGDDGAVLQSTVSDDREDMLELSFGESPSSPKRQPASPIHIFSSPSSKNLESTGRMTYGEKSSPSQSHRRRLFIRNLSLWNRKSMSTQPAPTPVS
mmetsp:Transcript_62846/g.153005  ORF Transcript_62846/g.153005 Transcript_62846/m.153005 type:complete len:1347 (+) Transcript_62846:632-4672(+)